MLAMDGRCKTLSAEADGYVRAEACGLLQLVSMDAEAVAGASLCQPLLGVLAGTSVNQVSSPASPSRSPPCYAAWEFQATALPAALPGTSADTPRDSPNVPRCKLRCPLQARCACNILAFTPFTCTHLLLLMPASLPCARQAPSQRSALQPVSKASRDASVPPLPCAGRTQQRPHGAQRARAAGCHAQCPGQLRHWSLPGLRPPDARHRHPAGGPHCES